MIKLLGILAKSLGTVGFVSIAVSYFILTFKLTPLAASIFVLAVVIHELGHVLYCLRFKQPNPRMIILPIGGVVYHEPESITPWRSAWIAIGGPLIGTAGALIGFFLYLRHGSAYFLCFSFLSVILNLSNMLPIFPMDGGRIVKVIDARILLLGVPIYLVGLFMTDFAITVIIIGVVFFMSLARYLSKTPPCISCGEPNERGKSVCSECGKPLKLLPEQNFKLSAAYLSLLIFLAVFTWISIGEIKENKYEVSKILLKK